MNALIPIYNEANLMIYRHHERATRHLIVEAAALIQDGGYVAARRLLDAVLDPWEPWGPRLFPGWVTDARTARSRIDSDPAYAVCKLVGHWWAGFDCLRCGHNVE